MRDANSLAAASLWLRRGLLSKKREKQERREREREEEEERREGRRERDERRVMMRRRWKGRVDGGERAERM